MIKRPFILTLLCVSVALSAGCTQGKKKISLRYKFVPGSSTEYRTTLKGNAKVFYGDSLAADRLNEIKLTTLAEVHSLDNDSIAVVEETHRYAIHRYDRLTAATVDTVSDGERLTLRLLPSGKLISAEQQASSRSEEVTFAQRSYDQGMPEFPARDLEQGESWTQTARVEIDGVAMEATTTYRVESFAREQGYDCVVLGYDGHTVLPFSASSSDSLHREGVNNLTVTGLMYFAYKEGLVVSHRERRVVDGHGRRWTGMNKASGRDYRIAVEYDIDVRLTQVSLLAFR